MKYTTSIYKLRITNCQSYHSVRWADIFNILDYNVWLRPHRNDVINVRGASGIPLRKKSR